MKINLVVAQVKEGANTDFYSTPPEHTQYIIDNYVTTNKMSEAPKVIHDTINVDGKSLQRRLTYLTFNTEEDFNVFKNDATIIAAKEQRLSHNSNNSIKTEVQTIRLYE